MGAKLSVREVVVHVGIALAVAALVAGVGSRVLPRPAWPDATKLSLTAVPREIGVVTKTGGVFQRQERGAWIDVKDGEALLAGTRLRASAASFGWVELTDRARIQVGAGSEVVVAADAAGARLEVERGAVRVPPDAAGAVLIGVDGGTVSARSGPLLVAVGAQGLRVQSEAPGEVTVALRGGQVSLQAGETARAAPGGVTALVEAAAGAPDPPGLSGAPGTGTGAASVADADSSGAAATAAARLATRGAAKVVAAKPPKVARGGTTVVTGKIAPGADIAIVKVAGVTAEIADDGTFTAVVPLKVGMNAIAIVTRDVFGNEDVYEIDPVRRLSEAEVRALKFEWQTRDDGSNSTTWGEP